MQFLNKITELLPNLADFLVYAAIAVVTVIGFFKCLLPLWNGTHALRRAIRRLQKDAGNQHDKPIWQESRFMGRRLRGYWLRFLQNAEQLDRRGLPCNVEDYINDDTVAHGPGNANLAEMIPSMLTSLGILGTFMGMMRGLGGLDFTNSAAIIAGIPTLLSGMQFAFGTSVAGVSCSIVFSMLNRIAQGSSYRAIDDFVESFTQLAMQRPLDNDVQLICQNQDTNHMLSSLTDTLPGQLTRSMEASISRTMQPVAQSMDSFLIGATRAQVDGVGRIVTNFVNQMNASLNSEFLELGRTLAEINQQQRLSSSQVEQSYLSAQAIMADVGKLQGVSQDVMAGFEHYIRELGDARRRDEAFEATSADLLGKMQQASDQQTQALERIRTCHQELTDAMTAMRKHQSATADSLSTVSETMEKSGDQLAKSYQSFVTDVVDGLSKALTMFDENMTLLINTMTAKVDSLIAMGTDGETAAQLSEIQRMLASMQTSLKKAAADFDKKEA